MNPIISSGIRLPAEWLESDCAHFITFRTASKTEEIDMRSRRINSLVGCPGLIAAALIALVIVVPESRLNSQSPENSNRGNGTINLSLPEAVEQALRNNLTLRTEAVGPNISRQQLRQEQGVFDPVLEGRVNRNSDGNPQLIDPFSGTRAPASVVRSDAYEASVNGLLPWGASYRVGGVTENRRGTFNSFEDRYFSFLGVSLTQPLLRGLGTGAALAGVRFAEKSDEIAELAFRQAVIDTITGTVLAFDHLLFTRGTYRIAETNHRLTLKLVDENEIRRRKGIMSEVDVLEARSRAAQRESRMILARRAYHDSENELKRILFGDFAPIRDKSLEPELPGQAEISTEQITDYMKSAYENRPDFQQALLSMEQRKIGLSFERSQFLPQLDLVASYGLNGLSSSFSGSWDQVRSGDADSYSVGAIVSIPLPNRTASARKQVAELQVERSLLELKDLESQIAVQLQNAAGQIDTARERVSVARTALDLAKQNLVAEEKRLQNGVSSTFLVLDRQERLAIAQLDELSALVSLNDAVASFNRLAGRTNYDEIVVGVLLVVAQ